MGKIPRKLFGAVQWFSGVLVRFRHKSKKIPDFVLRQSMAISEDLSEFFFSQMLET